MTYTYSELDVAWFSQPDERFVSTIADPRRCRRCGALRDQHEVLRVQTRRAGGFDRMTCAGALRARATH